MTYTNLDKAALTNLYALAGIWHMLQESTREDFQENLSLHHDVLKDIIKELVSYQGDNQEIKNGIRINLSHVSELEAFCSGISSLIPAST